MLKLSEDLQGIAESGDVGHYLDGYAERAAALEQQVDALLNLLAIIHRDGGQYTDSFGVLQSTKDAVSVVCAERVRLDTAEAELKAAGEQEPVAWRVRGQLFRFASDAILFHSMNTVCGGVVEKLYASPIPTPPAQVPKEWHEFVRDVANNYDCDSDAHRYGTPCRACEAKQLLATINDNSATTTGCTLQTR